MINPWYDFSATKKTFAFTFTVGPQVKFCFDKVVSASAKAEGSRPFKRRRPLWDVDGSTSEGKKKRRLLRFLITSPLSRPFSIPATNILDRPISKVLLCTKGRRLDKALLRKAAIMNRVRSRLDAVKSTVAKRDEELKKHAVALRHIIPVLKPRCYDLPRPSLPITRSPLVDVSNYDALEEDDMFDSEDGDDDHGDSVVDWNKRDPCRVIDEDDYGYDYLDDWDGIPHEFAELPEDRPPPPPDERMVEMMREKESGKELVSCIFSHSADFLRATGSTFVGVPAGKIGSSME